MLKTDVLVKPFTGTFLVRNWLRTKLVGETIQNEICGFVQIGECNSVVSEMLDKWFSGNYTEINQTVKRSIFIQNHQTEAKPNKKQQN